ncbi:MAG TPA: alpha/beta hydrolase [Gaiellaceae bacterium]|nr:alpha/beta hydrolase [Gaiellaceae bacterium]
MGHVEVNGAQLWVEDTGKGPAVVFVHGGLGDSRLWKPQARALADRFRCIRFDLRFFGRSEAPGAAWSAVDDVVGLLDALGVERAALVGLSMGGGIVLDVAVAHPDRVWAIAHVAGSVSGLPVNPYTDEQDAVYEAAVERGDLDAAMAIDFDVWAPLGADDAMRDMWRATPDARGLPDGAVSRPREPAHERLDEIGVPTLVILAAHDPEEFRGVGRTVAHRLPGARLVEVDSDHYLTLREVEQVDELLLEFLTTAAPKEDCT